MNQAHWYAQILSQKKKFGPVTSNSLVQFIIENQLDAGDVYVAQRGWKSWKKLLDVEDLNILILASLSDLPELATEIRDGSPLISPISSPLNQQLNRASNEVDGAHPKTKPVQLKEIQTEENQVEKKRSKENRNHERFDLKFKVVFIADGKTTFRTHSKNISEGGMLIEDALPIEFCNSMVNVFVASPKGMANIQFFAEVLRQGKNPRHIKFSTANSSNLDLLRAWMQTMNKTPIVAAPLKKVG